MFKVSSLALIAALAPFISSCIMCDPTYQEAVVMNRLAVGMPKSEMLEIMGAPSISSADDDFECAEYKLMYKGANYKHAFPSRHHVLMRYGKILEYGQGACYTSSYSINRLRDAEVRK